ncbi:MAG: inorganic phosphate transporter [Clostridia bacterium]|nr:inorganic phosphate transporter [Clostridia bacterium]
MGILEILVVLAVLGVLFVNGWTDAPNAIAAGVSTGAMTMGQGVAMATGMNLLGGAAALLMGQGVAETVGELGVFSSDGAGTAALAATLLAVILWSVAAWVFGIPTSESHGLMAAIMGGALALGAGGISARAVGKIAIGLVFSVGLGFLGGWSISLGFRRMRKRPRLWLWGQRCAAALMAFAHGLQDTPKFAAILFLSREGQELPLWGMLLCSGVMGLGTLCGGGRIIRKVGSEMVDIQPKEGFAADLAGTVSLLLSTLQGLPVSTTHAKTCALMGAAMGGREGTVDGKVVRSMFLAWILTFPACGLLAFLLTKLFLSIPF